MKNKFARLSAIVALVGTILAFSAPGVSAEPVCVLPGAQNDHLIVLREYHDGPGGDAQFDRIEGSATTRDLDDCTGTGAHGSYILPANLQNSLSGGSAIYQLGYSESDDGRKFVYAFDSPNAINIPGSWVPTLGTKYKYTIALTELPSGAGNVRYRITDTSNGQYTEFNKYQPNRWYGALAWWGAETGEIYSSIGNDHDNANINMTDMYYSRNNDGGALYRRDGLTESSVTTDNSAGALSSYDFYKSPNLDSESHHHVTTQVTTNDTVNFDNTRY